MKICYDLGFITIGVAMATLHDTITILIYLCVSGVFLRNRLREYVPAIIASIMAKFEQIL